MGWSDDLFDADQPEDDVEDRSIFEDEDDDEDDDLPYRDNY